MVALAAFGALFSSAALVLHGRGTGQRRLVIAGAVLSVVNVVLIVASVAR